MNIMKKYRRNRNKHTNGDDEATTPKCEGSKNAGYKPPSIITTEQQQQQTSDNSGVSRLRRIRAKNTYDEGERIKEREEITEKKRAEDVLEKAHPKELDQSYTGEFKECPICIELLSATADSNNDNFAFFSPCCGNVHCFSCLSQHQTTNQNVWICFYCREPLPPSYKELEKKYLTKAKKKLAWAQFSLGIIYQSNDQLDKAVTWYSLASKQGFSEATSDLGLLHFDQRNYKEARQLLESILPTSDYNVQAVLGLMFLGGLGGKVDKAEGIRMLTLSAAKGSTRSQVFLGEQFIKGVEGLAPPYSFDRALYWLKQAAEANNWEGQKLTAQLLIARSKMLFGPNNYLISVPGMSPIPVALRWYRVYLDNNEEDYTKNDDAERIKELDEIERFVCQECACCGKKQDELDEPLKRCIRCQVCYYCSKSCQLQHWSDGHKKDCNATKAVRCMKNYVKPNGSEVQTSNA